MSANLEVSIEISATPMQESFDKELTTGMRQTLQGIRSAVERGA